MDNFAGQRCPAESERRYILPKQVARVCEYMIKFSLFCEDGLFQNISSNIHFVDTEEDPYRNQMKCQSDSVVCLRGVGGYYYAGMLLRGGIPPTK